MTLKQLAYSAQQSLQASTQIDFKRTHVYELLAAAFDYNSYAAFNSEAVFTHFQYVDDQTTHDPSLIKKRCTELGYPIEVADSAPALLLDFINQHEIDCIPLHHLVEDLRDEESFVFYKHQDYDDEPSAHLLIEGLLEAASKNNPIAHHALALINFANEPPSGSDYWYLQEKGGRKVTGVEKEWADNYKNYLAKTEKFAFHLKEAARLGNQEALLDLADHFDDPTFFEQSIASVNANPMRVADIASKLGFSSDSEKWLIAAAEQGDLEAIEWLIEELKDDNLQQCWTWVYLAQMLGTDFTRSDYHAYHDDGTLYDDDVGGPLHVSGRDAIELEPLTIEQDIAAKQTAKELFSRIPQNEYEDYEK